MDLSAFDPTRSVDLSDVVLSLLALAGAGWGAFREYEKYWRQKRITESISTERRMVEILRDATKLQSYLEEARARLGAVRCMLLFAHNGGRPIGASQPLYSTIVHEASISSKTAMIGKWNEIADAQYIELLADICENGSRLIDRRDMRPGLLHDLYTTQDIDYALIRLVHSGKGNAAIWYVSAVMQRQEPPTPSDRDAVRVLVSQIREVIQLEDLHQQSLHEAVNGRSWNPFRRDKT